MACDTLTHQPQLLLLLLLFAVCGGQRGCLMPLLTCKQQHFLLPPFFLGPHAPREAVQAGGHMTTPGNGPRPCSGNCRWCWRLW